MVLIVLLKITSFAFLIAALIFSELPVPKLEDAMTSLTIAIQIFVLAIISQFFYQLGNAMQGG